MRTRKWGYWARSSRMSSMIWCILQICVDEDMCRGEIGGSKYSTGSSRACGPIGNRALLQHVQLTFNFRWAFVDCASFCSYPEWFFRLAVCARKHVGITERREGHGPLSSRLNHIRRHRYEYTSTFVNNRGYSSSMSKVCLLTSSRGLVTTDVFHRFLLVGNVSWLLCLLDNGKMSSTYTLHRTQSASDQHSKGNFKHVHPAQKSVSLRSTREGECQARTACTELSQP